ncbi:OmpA family protein [Muriicola marianensis]|nr:OmpA family protein [Muriicola marianensis]
MKKKLILLGCVTCLAVAGYSQSKKELLLRLEERDKEILNLKNDLTASKQEAARYKAEMEAVNFQMEELKATNASLLQNLTNFTELSNKKTENISKSLETLRNKEIQLKKISDALTSTDSTTLALLTSFKNTLGSEVKTGLSGGAVTIILDNLFLFKEVDRNYQVVPEALPVLEKVASVLKKHPGLKIMVEANSNALEFKDIKLKDNWDLSSLQASSVVRVLADTYGIDPNRIQAVGKSEYGFNGIETTTRIRIQPPYEKFYGTIREMMK